jgi:glycosyltransferase involved in cell wall biosynthesis
MGKPMVSVVIPYYNGSRFLANAVASVFAQSYRDFEIVVVDDGSHDDVAVPVRAWCADRRLRVLRHEENRGIGAARNTGLAACRGDYVAFLDQDDTWRRRKLELQVEWLASAAPDVALLFSDVVEVDRIGRSRPLTLSGEIPPDLNRIRRENQLRALFSGNFIPLIAALARTRCVTAVGGFDESIKGGADDYELCLRLVSHYRIAYVPGIVASHRTHGDNYSANFERLVSDNFRFLASLAARHPQLQDLLDPRLGRLHYELGKYYLHTGNTGGARASFAEAARYGMRQRTLRQADALARLGSVGSWLFRARRFARRRLVW